MRLVSPSRSNGAASRYATPRTRSMAAPCLARELVEDRPAEDADGSARRVDRAGRERDAGKVALLVVRRLDVVLVGDAGAAGERRLERRVERANDTGCRLEPPVLQWPRR